MNWRRKPSRFEIWLSIIGTLIFAFSGYRLTADGVTNWSLGEHVERQLKQ